MPDIFLSYSRTDQPTALRFAEALKREGFSVWWDQTLRSGENYDEVTERALREARAVVVLWSKSSVDSRWVRAEATSAERLGRLVPVMIETCNRPIMFELKHTADLAHWKGEAKDPAWRSYVEDVRRYVDAGGALADPGTGSPRPESIAAPSAQSGGRGKTLAMAAGAASLLAAGAFWAVLHWSGPAVRPRICVLPLTSRSAGADNAAFADGLHELLLTVLANRAPGMDVISSTTMNSFRGKSLPVTELAKPPISCTHVLEGAVFREDQLVRLNVQLIEAKTDTHIWAHTYDRQLVKSMTLQSDVADEVAGQLSARLAAKPAAAAPTTNPAAYELYIRAQGALGVATRPVEESRRVATALLDQAIGMDSRFGLAYLLRSDIGATLQLRAADLESARSLLGNTSKVRARGANIAFTQSGFDAQPALRELEGAGPDAEADPDFLASKGRFLLYAGRIYEALGFLQRQVALDPANIDLLVLYAGALEAARKPAEALRIYDLARLQSRAPIQLELRRSRLLLSYSGRTEALRAVLDRDGAKLPDRIRLGYEAAALRFEHRYAELTQQLGRTSEIDLLCPMLYERYLCRASQVRGFTALLAGDRHAATAAGEALRKQSTMVYFQAQGEAERAIRENFLGMAEVLAGNPSQALLYMRSREQARTAPEHAGIWANPMMQLTSRASEALVYAWAGADDKAVALLEDLAVREAGLGPADIARDPLFTVPLKNNARFQALVRKLEAQMAANPLE